MPLSTLCQGDKNHQWQPYSLLGTPAQPRPSHTDQAPTSTQGLSRDYLLPPEEEVVAPTHSSLVVTDCWVTGLWGWRERAQSRCWLLPPCRTWAKKLESYRPPAWGRGRERSEWEQGRGGERRGESPSSPPHTSPLLNQREMKCDLCTLGQPEPHTAPGGPLELCPHTSQVQVLKDTDGSTEKCAGWQVKRCAPGTQLRKVSGSHSHCTAQSSIVLKAVDIPTHLKPYHHL